MRELETDYLVVGAGASGMAFVDALIEGDGHDVVMVDRRHRPGGHWLNAYPFVRIHQSSANYGVNSMPLGQNRIDQTGPNAGYYERATATEISAYFARVMDDHFLPSGRVEFLANSDYRGQDADGHHVVSLITGEETVVRVRKRFVDATYTESSIPSRHTPGFVVDTDVNFIPPNDLVDLDGAPTGFTIIGAGKTAMDTVNWLLDSGVDPDKIRWVRKRDAWLFDRGALQPLELIGAYMEMQARWVEAAAEAESGTDFAHRMEDAGVFLRLDRSVEPLVFRGATISPREVDSLRSIERVVRSGRVMRITTSELAMDDGSAPSSPGEVYVDCTAAGIPVAPPRPIFEPDRITLQYVTIGIVPYSAALIGAAERLKGDDTTKNRLSPPLTFSGNVSDILTLGYVGMSGISARGADRELSAWDAASRLNPSRGASDHMDDPRVPAAFGVMGAKFGDAMRNLERHANAAVATTV